MHTFAQTPRAGQQTTPATSDALPARSQFAQTHHVNSNLHFQGAIGNQAAQRMRQAGAEGPEAGLNEPGDSYEQEAERLAEQVTRIPEPRRQPIERIEPLPLRPAGAPPVGPDLLRSGGQPLDPPTRSFMEPRFGHDFSQVRLHTGRAAEDSARALNANAYTVGRNIVFGAGQFAPETQAGRRLIAHELSHVVQQGDGDRRISESTPPLSAAPTGHVQRQTPPGGSLTGAPQAPLTVVARRIAELVLGPHQAAMGAFHGPVLTVIRDKLSGEIFVGLNTGVPPKLADVIYEDILAHQAQIWSGKIQVVHTDPLAMGGGHSEINALNSAVLEHEAGLGRKMTQAEYDTFKGEQLEMENVWLKGAERRLTIAASCEHCVGIGGGIPTVPTPAPVAPPAQEVHGEIPGDFGGAGGPGESTAQDVLVGESKAGRLAARLGSVLEFAGPFADAFVMLLNYRDVGIDNSAWPDVSKKLLPIVFDTLKARSAEITKVGQGIEAFYGVFANVKCELHYRYVASATGTSLGQMQLYDARFLGVSITAQDVNETDDWDRERGRKAQEGIRDATFSIRLYVPPHPEVAMRAATLTTPTDPPLYLSQSLRRSSLPPQPMTLEGLLSWARIHHPRLFDDPGLSKEILSSQEFTGSRQAREQALIDLQRWIQEQKQL